MTSWLQQQHFVEAARTLFTRGQIVKAALRTSRSSCYSYSHTVVLVHSSTRTIEAPYLWPTATCGTIVPNTPQTADTTQHVCGKTILLLIVIAESAESGAT